MTYGNCDAIGVEDASNSKRDLMTPNWWTLCYCYIDTQQTLHYFNVPSPF